ncbi:Activator of Hsp90 ATPase 1 family protein [Candidatus Sulfopaludibacter sp. SbA3]|nr:Activator of Hsp90 ATPase 1 family protein [Candidatus Sulfopaludibacter sp. SbA3]
MTVEIQGEAIAGEIEIEAPPEKVFDALVDPAQLTEWWGSADTYRTFNWQVDVRPGGAWRCEAQGPTGPVSTVGGRYLVVDRPNRLSYTWNPSWAPGEESQVHYTLEAAGSGTRVSFKHEGFITATSREAHSMGWKRVAGWLQEHFQREDKRQ